jgi:3-deoxy-D-manno-octulosonate 8-phosphate phosphatase (KDO 8-P phosphatase)
MSYSPAQDIAASLKQKLAQIELLVLDVDGVLSDGKVYYSNTGDELKNFNIKDGLGIKLAQKYGIEIAIITGRESEIVARRARELGIEHLYQGKTDKRQVFASLIDKLRLSDEQVAHMGDDLPDIPLMLRAGLGLTVADAHPVVVEHADWQSQYCGGGGAVREAIDLLLDARGMLQPAQREYVTSEALK